MALTMLGVSAMALSFVLDGDATGVARLAAGVPLIAALIIVLVTGARRRPNQRPSDRAVAGSTVIAAFLVGALAFSYLTDVTAPSPTDEDAQFQLQLSEDVTTVPVTRLQVNVDEAYVNRVVDNSEAQMSSLREISGRQAEALVSAARAAGYEPRAATALDWDAATAQRAGDTPLVTVPVSGTADPVLNKVVFMARAGAATVMEYSGFMIDAATLHFEIWQDGRQTKNVDVVNEAAVSADGVLQVFDWNAFNRCLSSQGISWALLTAIGIACSAICAGTLGLGCVACLSFAAGGWSGTVVGCYRLVA